MRLNVHDLARIGLLIQNDGYWQGNQVISESWLRLSTAPHAKTTEGELCYGFFWWLSAEGQKPEWWAGCGNGGQRLMIDPDNHLVVVIFAGNYDDPEAWQLPVKVLTDHIYPML